MIGLRYVYCVILWLGSKQSALIYFSSVSLGTVSNRFIFFENHLLAFVGEPLKFY